MNIIACSYANLWPFANRMVSLVVHPWAAMIIAPVGTGKSMLFFDWPVYGLYKYGTRDVLNNACTTGSISILVDIDGEYWLVRRQLKASKTRSISTTSSLARYHGDVSQVYVDYPAVLYADRDIISELDVSMIDEIVFKNETDLQKNLEEFLPARDVFMNRDMMMQESSNLFDLTQTQRIDVFKHLFWLLDIDQAKDRLWEEKTKLKYLLQAKQDTSVITGKFAQAIDQLSVWWKQLSDSTLVDLAMYEWASVQSWLYDSSVLGTTISIDKVAQLSWAHQDQIRAWLETHKWAYHTVQAQLAQSSKLKAQSEQQHKEVEMKIAQLSKELAQHDITLKTYNSEALQWLKSDKLTLIQKINDLEFAIDYDAFDANVEDLQQAYEYVTGLTQTGKELQLQMTNIQTQITALQDKKQTQITNHQSQLDNLDKQLAQFNQQISVKQEKLDIASKFYCVKIEADCPFVEQISGGVLTAHERELTLLLEQRTTLLWSIEQAKTVTTDVTIEQHIIRLTDDKSQLEAKISDMRVTLVKVWYKQISESYPAYQQYQQQLKQLDMQIMQYDTKLKEMEQISNQRAQVILQLEGLQVKSEEWRVKNEELTKQLEELQAESWTLKAQYEHITNYESVLQKVVDMIKRINELIQDYKTSQREIIWIQTRAKHIDELYTIVSKELTVIVLQEYLPILSDIINNQLAKVVDYRLEFSVNPAGDKLEIMIIDQYGSREVKSLSGWQRAVLRLCWILAIALWSGNKFLFLDETINHLDTEMVSKAAELIEEFVQWNKVTLYAITHSEQIQSMDIWDHVVRVREALG